MENPGSWDSLTASLAVSDLGRIDAVWEFLVGRGQVRNAPGDKETFAKLLRQESDRGDVIGPSVAARVATGLKGAGMALPAGDAPDPFGKAAAEAWKQHAP